MTKIADASYPTRTVPDGTEWLHAVDVSHATDYKLNLLTALKLLWAQIGLWTKAQAVVPVKNATATGTVTLDFTSSNNQRLLMTGNVTLANPTLASSSGSDGVVVNIYLKQDATGGRTLAFGTKFKWAGGTVPTWSTGANAVNFMSCYYDATDDVIVCNGGSGYV